MLQRSTTTSGPSLQTERKPQSRDRERCTWTSHIYMNTIITMRTASLIQTMMNNKLKKKHKGRCYCFCAAIQGPNPLAGEAPEHLAGLVPGSISAFCPQKKGDHLGDYHKVSMVTITSNGSETNSLQTCTNPHLQCWTMQPITVSMERGSPNGTG
jgi:hypothetical protein